jgi:hypothetical protein
VGEARDRGRGRVEEARQEIIEEETVTGRSGV